MTDDFQRQAGVQGRTFEDAVAHFLEFTGWKITARRMLVEGVEIDLVAEAPDGVTWWIECKGSHRGTRPGSKRSDTVKKAVAVAWYLSLLPQRQPYMLVTSHLPEPGTVSARLLDAARAAGLFADVQALGLLTYSVDDEDDDE